MVTAEAARNIVGVVGNVISFGLFLSPAHKFYKIIKKKSTEELNPGPHIATTLNCMCWIFYGMPFVYHENLPVITVNGVGLLLELIYLAIFFAYSDNIDRKRISFALVAAILFVAVVVLITMMALHETMDRSLMVGLICDVINFMIYVAPLANVSTIIKTKSVESIPFTLTLTTFLNCCVWTAYSLIKLDGFILISNLLGALYGFVQLILYACYCKTTPPNN